MPNEFIQSTPKSPFTLARNPGGQPRHFAEPADLWYAACAYFDYCADNPVPYQVVKYRRIITEYQKQAMSLNALYLHIGVCNLNHYKKLPGFSAVVKRIYNVIYVYNFTGAAAGLLKGRVIGWTLR